MAIIEIWKDIDGYGGVYQISNMGQIRSKTRKVHNYIKPGRILKTHNNGRDYLSVTLSANGIKQKHAYIHILVAKAFINNPKNLPEVNHKDFDKSNNKVENLEWMTRKENREHYIKSKRHYAAFAKRSIKTNTEYVKRILLAKEDVINGYDTGKTVKEMSEDFNLTKELIADILLIYGKVEYKLTQNLQMK